MPDIHAAFRSAIGADPDTDGPRLIYADWLEEHGDADRAEFIRVQCELARLGAEDCESQALFEALQERQDPNLDRVDWKSIDRGVARRWELHGRQLGLLKRHGKTWRGAAPQRCGIKLLDPHYPSSSWHRGCLEGGTLNSATPLRRSADVLKQVPIRFLALPRPDVGQAQALIDSGLLGWVTGLWFDYGAAEFLRTLGAHPDARCITSLSSSMVRSDIGDVVRALIDSSNWCGLRGLNLRGSSDVPDKVAEELLRAGHLQRLILLRLNAGRWSGDPVRTLAAGFPELRTLELFGCPLNDEAARALANSSSLNYLRTLEVGSSGITGRGVSSLIASPQLPRLTVLTFDWCRSRNWKLDEKLLSGTRGSSLRSLEITHLHRASLTPSAVRALVCCPALGDLLVLDLSTNRLNDRTLSALHHAAFTRLAVLDLSYNRFGDRGVTALAQWPGLRSVRYLNLRENGIGDRGAQALADSPYLRDVQVLLLGREKMSPAGLKSLRMRFGGTIEAF